VLALLARHGVDLGAPCDGEGDDAHGTPARGLSARPRGRALRTMRSRCRMYKGFRAQVLRAVYHGKVRVLEALVRLGVDPDAPCTRFGELPSSFFELYGPGVAAQLTRACNVRHRAATACARFLWMGPRHRRFHQCITCVRALQAHARRCRVRCRLSCHRSFLPVREPACLIGARKKHEVVR